MSAYFIDGRKTIKTILTENIDMEGELFFEDSLEINGIFSGTIRSKGLLIIGKTAIVRGDIYSKNLIVEGKVIGNVLVYNRLSIEAEAEIIGNITTHKIKVTNQATIEGDCATIPASEVEKMFQQVALEKYFRTNYDQQSKKDISMFLEKTKQTPEPLLAETFKKTTENSYTPSKKKKR